MDLGGDIMKSIVKLKVKIKPKKKDCRLIPIKVDQKNLETIKVSDKQSEIEFGIFDNTADSIMTN